MQCLVDPRTYQAEGHTGSVLPLCPSLSFLTCRLGMSADSAPKWLAEGSEVYVLEVCGLGSMKRLVTVS